MHDLTLFLHKMTAASLYSRYLPVEPSLIDWGMYVLDAGSQNVSPGSDYPVGRHPEEYLFSWNKGRVLDEYQLVYISAGEGVFEWEGHQREQVMAGDIILLRPGLWHRYQPDSETGWSESWVGFQGEYAKRLVEKFFPEDKALLKVGHSGELLRKLHAIVEMMQNAPAGYRQMMAGETVAALARVRSLVMRADKLINEHEQKMDRARYYLLAHAAEEIDLEALASELGMSYSRFRNLFRKHTGSSPRKYQLDIRMNRAMELLRESERNVSEIAEVLGFSSVYYFSRLFKQRTGKTPVEFRREFGN